MAQLKEELAKERRKTTRSKAEKQKQALEEGLDNIVEFATDCPAAEQQSGEDLDQSPLAS